MPMTLVRLEIVKGLKLEAARCFWLNFGFVVHDRMIGKSMLENGTRLDFSFLFVCAIYKRLVR